MVVLFKVQPYHPSSLEGFLFIFFFFQFLNEEGCSEFFSRLDYNNLTNTAWWLHKQVFIYSIMI